MGDSQQPKPAASLPEVPDLELEPRSFRAPAAPARASAPSPNAKPSSIAAPNLFDDDAFMSNASGLELGLGSATAEPKFSEAGFDALGGLELVGNDQPRLDVDDGAPHSTRTAHTTASPEASAWPTGHAPDRARLGVDPAELSLLAGYGEPPTNPLLTPAYAYRVFLRQRELKAQLLPLDRELSNAERERENALVELARVARPEAERVEQLKRLLAPLLELERVAASRTQALSAASSELSQQTGTLDVELESLTNQLELATAGERDAQRAYDAEHEIFRRAEAKLKRVHIEIRAVTQIAEQKLGPSGGQVPEPEASQLAGLRERATATEPEVQAARASLETARNALDRATQQVQALRQSERLAGRKKQALVSHYQHELDLRGRSLNDNAEQERRALAELGRAVLALRGGVPVPPELVAQVRRASEHADALTLRAELHLRALDSYDRARAAQGVRLACTVLGIFVVLIALKILL